MNENPTIMLACHTSFLKRKHFKFNLEVFCSCNGLQLRLLECHELFWSYYHAEISGPEEKLTWAVGALKTWPQYADIDVESHRSALKKKVTKQVQDQPPKNVQP